MSKHPHEYKHKKANFIYPEAVSFKIEFNGKSYGNFNIVHDSRNIWKYMRNLVEVKHELIKALKEQQ